LIFAKQIRALTGAPDCCPYDLWIERLGDEIKGSLPHTLYRKLNGRHGGEENYGHRWIALVRNRQNFQPVSIRHFLVRDHYVVITFV
jgi:hypothetical protein